MTAPARFAPILLVMLIAGCGGSGPGVFPSGAGRADWWVDPAALPLSPEDRTISAFLQERACASGQTPEGRILGPRIEYEPDAIVITFRVREDLGDCQGNPKHPITIQLEQPLGSRVLLDGGVTPPRDATIDPTSSTLDGGRRRFRVANFDG
jgi:hypothetical protein